jgi:hypothetical protein
MPPQTLQGTKDFIRSLKPGVPVPGWFFNLLDGLDEVEDTMSCSALRLRGCLLFATIELYPLNLAKPHWYTSNITKLRRQTTGLQSETASWYRTQSGGNMLIIGS